MDDMVDEIDKAFQDDFPETDGDPSSLNRAQSRLDPVSSVREGDEYCGKSYKSIHPGGAFMYF